MSEQEMINALTLAEDDLPELLDDGSGWHGIFANAEKPFLRRLWRQWGEFRISLHHFSSCEPKEEFPHPHPWKMAVRILEGRYVMGTGRSSDPNSVPELTYINYKPGDCYELLDLDIWHAIRPLDSEALTIMVSGPVVYPQNRIRANKPVRELTPRERSTLLRRARKHYPSR
jgi:hypothetical protein